MLAISSLRCPAGNLVEGCRRGRARRVGHQSATVPYLVYGGLLVLAILALLITPETRSVPTDARPAYHVQQMHIPTERGPFVGPLATAAVAFAAFGLFTSLAPSFLAGPVHTRSLALAGVAAFTVFGGSAASQVLLARRNNRELVLTGTVGLTLGFAAVVLAVWLSTPSLGLSSAEAWCSESAPAPCSRAR